MPKQTLIFNIVIDSFLCYVSSYNYLIKKLHFLILNFFFDF